MQKFLLHNVKLCDGVKFFDEPGSVLLDNHQIIEVNPTSLLEPVRQIDGAGRTVAPGFIDAHGHSDVAMLDARNHHINSKRAGGFVLEIAGNCGLSAFPLTKLNRTNLQKIYSRYQVELSWSDYAGYQSQSKSKYCQPTVLALCGHNTLRSALFGYQKNHLSNSDLRQMQSLLSRQFEQGCLGLSAGLLYSPGRYANDKEMVALLETVQKYDRIFALHLRNEGDELLSSIKETLRWASISGLKKLHISHLKTSGKDNFDKLDAVMELLDAARMLYDMRITFDAYPYSWSMTQLSVSAPEEYLALPDAMIMDKLQKSNAERDKTLAFLTNHGEEFWSNAILVSTQLEEFQRFRGQTFAQIQEKLKRPAPKIVLEILSCDSINTMAAFHTMSDQNVWRILSNPMCLCGTDEIARPLDESLGLSHPRNFGSSAKFIRMFLDADKPIAEAIRRLSFNAAEVFGVSNYGKIEAGFSSQVVLIDPSKIQDNSSFTHPHLSSSGIELLNLS